MKIKNYLNSLLIVTIFGSCTLDPKYQRPNPAVPFISPQSSEKKKISQVSWQEFFTSPDLQRVVQLALDNNRDLKIANLNIESARENHDIALSNLLPTISGVGAETRQKAPAAFKAFTPKKQFRANLTLASYELDFFGRLRSLKRSALEDFLASEQARNVTRIALVSETVNSYAQLLLDSEILKISKESLVAQSERYKFSDIRYKNGIDSQEELLDNQAVMENAKIIYENYEKLVEQDNNALMALTGVFDLKSLPQNTTINDLKINEELLDLVPSEALLARPDIKQAEHNLKSSNANIGAARAAFFPSITLTGTYGYGSRELNDLLNSRTWNFTPQINLPIFSGGRNMANLEIAHLRKKVEIATYEKTIQNAFREAMDQLAERKSVKNQLNSFNKILKAKQMSNKISNDKHRQGINSGLTVLDSKIAMLTAKQNQITIKKEYITNLISLYKVFGGGSDVEEELKH